MSKCFCIWYYKSSTELSAQNCDFLFVLFFRYSDFLDSYKVPQSLLVICWFCSSNCTSYHTPFEPVWSLHVLCERDIHYPVTLIAKSSCFRNFIGPSNVSVWRHSVGVTCLRLPSKQRRIIQHDDNADKSFSLFLSCLSRVTTCELLSEFLYTFSVIGWKLQMLLKFEQQWRIHCISMKYTKQQDLNLACRFH